MTRREAEALPLGALVVVRQDGQKWLGRLWCADAKWTADMRGMAVLHRVDQVGREIEPSSPYSRKARLVPRRCLEVIA